MVKIVTGRRPFSMQRAQLVPQTHKHTLILTHEGLKEGATANIHIILRRWGGRGVAVDRKHENKSP